MPKRNREAYIN